MSTTGSLSLGKIMTEVSRMADDVKNALTSQKDIAVRLPAQVVTQLGALHQTLEKLAGQVNAQEGELARLRALASTSEVINSSLDLDTVLSEVMDTIIKLTSAERGFLMLIDSQGELQFRIARGMEREVLDKNDFKVSRTILNSVASDGQPVVTTNAAADPRFSAQESVIGYNLRSIVCVPLKVKGRVTGVIYVDNRIRAGLFTEKERDLLAAFSNQAAIAIENARQFQEVNELKELLDNVFASIASGVITTNFEDKITLANSAATQILGRAWAELEGQPLLAAVPEANSELTSAMTRVKQSRTALKGHELNYEVPGRGSISWNVNVAPLRDSSGQGQEGLAIVLDDVTEQKRLRNKFEVFTRMVPPQVVERLNVDSLQLGGIRKEVSIVFADIQGFTTLSETLDPEILIEKLNQYVGTAAEAMLLHEATVDKFIGDAVMAFFNAPDDQPDHTLRAVRAALQMRDDITDLRETMEPPFRLNFRVAVHRGDAVVGLVGTKDRLDYTIIGDTVNTAKRIQDNGIPGKVIISDKVYEEVKDHVLVNPLEPMIVKGRVQPVTVYELVGLK